ncbi:MAG TPA: hypothetical protein VFD89_05120 [Clostridia bacterium]|nr:hypothetical protein [Clostridia bacterium]
MKIPDVVGQELDKGLEILKNGNGLFSIIINECTLPDDFYKTAKADGIKRIVRQNIISGGALELIIFNFNETPDRPL